MELRSLYYDLPGFNHGPGPDDFVVSIGKKGIGTVYHVAESRRSPKQNRYNLKVYVANDLKSETRIQPIPHRWIRRAKLRNRLRTRQRIAVRGKHAYPLVWYPRIKKT
jgi:hypothetical protein